MHSSKELKYWTLFLKNTKAEGLFLVEEFIWTENEQTSACEVLLNNKDKNTQTEAVVWL